MTMILSCITNDFVVQASDRRLVFPDGRLAEDRRNKALFFCGHTAWAYTGLARISGQPTDDWMSNTVARSMSLQEAKEVLCNEAAKALRTMTWPGNIRAEQRKSLRRLAFFGVGFADQDLSSGRPLSVPIFPFVTILSNFFDEGQGWLPGAKRDFSEYGWTLRPGAPFLLLEGGQLLTSVAKAALERDLRRCVAHGAGPFAFCRLLVRAIRKTHDDGNQAVGRNVMCTLIPKESITIGDATYEGGLVPLDPDAGENEYFRAAKGRVNKMYVYVPGSRGDQVHYGPNSCCLGLQIRGMRFEPVGDPADRRWTASLQSRDLGMPSVPGDD